MTAETTAETRHPQEGNLWLLSIFHYLVAVWTGMYALWPIFHFLFGVFMVLAPLVIPYGPDTEGVIAVQVMGVLFVLFFGGMIAIGLGFAALIALSGSFLANKKHYWFVAVMAAFSCLFSIYGTALGILTLVVLTRPGVQALFKNAKQEKQKNPPDTA